MTTNDKWYVMEDLFLDKLYEVYVVASDGRVTSRSSSVITILAAPGIHFFLYLGEFTNFLSTYDKNSPIFYQLMIST